MRLLSSSIPSSKSASPAPKPPGQSWIVGLWALLFLGVIDVTVNRLLRYPTGPNAAMTASRFQTYFEYGRSLEGKINTMVGPTDAETSLVAQAGWLDPEQWKREQLPTGLSHGKQHLIAVYGQSFTLNVADRLAKLDPSMAVRGIGAPAGPPSYAYAAYTLDLGGHQADIVMLGLLASSVKGMTAMNGMTWQFEGPAPYTYPRYIPEDGKLKEIQPVVQTLDQFRTARHNPAQWEAFVNQLRQSDRYYNDFFFRQNWLDNSTIVRLVRRSLAQQQQTAILNRIHSSQGFTDPSILQVLSLMVQEFAQTAKADGKFPVVLLVHDKGYGDHLYQALQPVLEDKDIPYISTHAIAPATDISNFVSDGHFTDTANAKIATALHKLLLERGVVAQR